MGVARSTTARPRPVTAAATAAAAAASLDATSPTSAGNNAACGGIGDAVAVGLCGTANGARVRLGTNAPCTSTKRVCQFAKHGPEHAPSLKARRGRGDVKPPRVIEPVNTPAGRLKAAETTSGVRRAPANAAELVEHGLMALAMVAGGER